MKRFILLLIVLLAAQSYGVYGGTEARKITVDCELELGILCYDWRPNALGRLVGEDGAGDLEERLERAEAAWEREVRERLEKAEDGDLGRVLDRIGEIGREGLERVREAAERLGGEE